MKGQVLDETEVRLAVGIGASAGGLEAFKKLVPILPVGAGMTYLLVQHLDPNHKSLLRDILAPLTSLDVREASDAVVVEPDTIYVIPPGVAMAITAGQLELTEPTLHRGVRLPVDHLFRSLAREYGPRAVGIVLSGAGSDGSSGLREIKAAGGLTLAQDPKTSGQTGMPQSAIETGIVDLVVGIAEFPTALDRFASLPLKARRVSAEGSPEERSGEHVSNLERRAGLSEREMARLAAVLEMHADFDIRVYKSGTVKRRVLRRMVLSGQPDVRSYVDFLTDDVAEQQSLVRDLLISVTEFFRDPAAFNALRETVVESLVMDAIPGARLRIWVPGCATGEEPYSLAMQFLDAIDRCGKSIAVQIFATDVDQEGLAVARAGVYAASIAEHVSSERLNKYFQPIDGGTYQVRSSLRDSISFAAHDLTRDPPFSRMDLVTCRNVLIYLRPETQRYVLKSLHFALCQNGYLFLGSSESTGQHRGLFTSVSKTWRIYRKLGSSRPVSTLNSRHRSKREKEEKPVSRDTTNRPGPTGGEHDIARRSVLQARVDPTLIVAENGDILFLHGDLRPYLTFPQGDDPRLDLNSIITPDLATRTRGALYKCRRDRNTVIAQASQVHEGRHVQVTATPADDVAEGAVILTFEDIDTRAAEPTGSQTQADSAMIDTLERELSATREDLRNTVEELESSNEELRSSNEESMSMNEELQSANEELEATAEELRSLNEELTTVNNQLREKIDLLEQSHDDLTNFFASTKVATVFLDDQLSIKRFTPAAAEMLGLREGDTGRFIGDIARDLLHNGLETDARTVLDQLGVQSRELRVGDRWITRQVLPYRTQARRIEGVVVTFMDVTDLKLTSERLALRERQQAVVARMGLYALRNADLQSFMDQAVREVQQTLETDFCKILELQPGGKSLLLRAGVGWQEGLAGSAFVPAGADSQAGFTLESAEPVIVTDLSTERRFSGPDLLIEHGVVSGLSSVIRDGDHVYGILGAHTNRRKEFTHEDANFLQAVATVIGSAVGRHRAKLMAGLEKGVAKALAESVAPEEAFRSVLQCFADELRVSVGEIWWPRPDLSKLNRGYFHVSIDDILDDEPLTLGDCEFESGEQMVARVFREGRAIWCTNIGDPEMFVNHSGTKMFGIVSGFAFPIRAGREVRGVVAIFSQHRLGADHAMLSTLEALGRSLGEYVARSEIEQKIKHLASITASSQDAILSYNADNVVMDWLPGAERLYGYTTEEMVGKSIEHIVPGNSRERFRAISEKIFDGELIEPMETVRVRKDGTQLEVSARVSPIRDAGGSVVGVSSADRDVSGQKEVERKLVIADRQKDEFLAMLSHELRNPLATIRSAAELLKLNPGDEQRLRRTQEVLERQSVHMAKLLDGLLDVSRIIRGKIHIERTTLDLGAVCRDVCEDVQDRVANRNLRLRTDLPSEPVWILGDVVRITQIIDNLMSNAVKYTPDGGTVSVKLTTSDGTAVLSVHDTGIGIPGDLLPDVFDVFRQAAQTLDRTSGGLGLGLALVKSLVDLHGGTIVARSEGKDRGAEFVVTLPLAPGQSTGPVEIAAPTLDPLSILIIEDNIDSAEMLREVLEYSGHQITIASSGEEGVAIARENSPDLILCDLGLPAGMSGYDVARAIRDRAETRDLRLVALSGYARPEDRIQCMEAGFDDHITKPVDVRTIAGVVARLAGREVEHEDSSSPPQRF